MKPIAPPPFLYSLLLRFWRSSCWNFWSALSEAFFTRRIKFLSRTHSFKLYDKLGTDFFSTCDLFYPNMKGRLRLIWVGPTFYMISDNPNVSLGNVDCSVYTRRFALRDDCHQKTMDTLVYNSVEINCLETLAKTFINPARQSQLIQENKINNAPIHPIAFAMNSKSALTGSYTEITFSHEQFNLRQLEIPEVVSQMFTLMLMIISA